jgi:hypothetical protein
VVLWRVKILRATSKLVSWFRSTKHHLASPLCGLADFSLDSLRIGDHFFYRSKYERKTHHFSDVDRPASGLLGSNPSLRKPAARGSGKPEKEDVSTAPVVLEEDVFELMRAAERHQKTISQETAVALGEE